MTEEDEEEEEIEEVEAFSPIGPDDTEVRLDDTGVEQTSWEGWVPHESYGSLVSMIPSSCEIILAASYSYSNSCS